MIVAQTLLTDHFNLSNREFRKKYSEGLKIIEISDGFEKSKPSFETSNTGKYIAIKSDEDKYLVFYSKGTNIISENYSVISVFDLDQEIESNKIYENWIVEKPALFILHNDGTWSMNEKGIINLDKKVEIENLINPINSIIKTKPLFEKIEKPKIKEEFNQKTEELIEVTNELDDIEVESLIITNPSKIEIKTNKKVKLSRFFKLSIVAIIILVAIFYFREISKILDSDSNETIKEKQALKNSKETANNKPYNVSFYVNRYVNQFPLKFTKDLIILSELKRLMGKDYKIYKKDFLSNAGGSAISKEGDNIICDLFIPHIGGYNSIIIFNNKKNKVFLYWLQSEVSEKKQKFYGDVNNDNINIVKKIMNSQWGVVGKFKSNKLNNGIEIELIKKDLFNKKKLKKSDKLDKSLNFTSLGNFSEGLALVGIGNKYGFINKSGEIVIQPKFDNASEFSEGLASVSIGKKVVFINKSGEIVIQPKFDNASEFSEGLACVRIGNKDAFINKSGEIVIQPKFDLASSFSEGLASVSIGNKYGFINKYGKIVIQPKFDLASSFSEGLALVGIGNKDAFINKSGEIVIQPKFDLASSFSEGLACVRIGNKYGFINKYGKIVIQPKFDLASSFSEGLACVRIGNKYGFINKYGKIVIQPKFDLASSFSESLSYVHIGNKCGFINHNKNWVLIFEMPKSFFDDYDAKD